MNVLVVNNTAAGQGDAGLFDYVRELSARGAEVTLRTLGEGGIAHVLRDAASHDRVVAAGGDGTVSSIAYALRETEVPVLAYPAGTANLLAANLHVPMDPARCADVTLSGRRARIDLGEITYGGDTTGFVINAGAGFDASIVEGAVPLKPQIGAGAYLVSAMRNIEPTLSEMRLTLDGETVETRGSAVLVMNFARLQFDITVTRDSHACDGVFEIAVVKAGHVAALIPAVVYGMIDAAADLPDPAGVIDTYKASDIEVTCDPPLPLQADGETLGSSSPFRVRVLPRAATFLAPERRHAPRTGAATSDAAVRRASDGGPPRSGRTASR